MKKSTPLLSPAQREFLSVFAAMEQPVSVDLAQTVAPLATGELLDLVRRAERSAWLLPSGPDSFRISPGIPPSLKRELDRVNTPERISALLEKITRMGWRDCMETATLVRLYRAAGRGAEAAEVEYELAERARVKGDFSAAAAYLDEVATFCRAAPPGGITDSLFVKAVLLLSGLRLRLGRNLGDIPGLLHQALAAAERIGDRRSRALINLHQGRFSYLADNLEDALRSLAAGLDEAEELDDEDMAASAAEFVGLYYFLQGMYVDAAKHFDRALPLLRSGSQRPDTFFVSYASAYCLAFLGRFTAAVGIMESYRCSYRRHEPALANLFRAGLGIVLTMMGRRDDALVHLRAAAADSRRLGAVQPLLLARLGLSYHYFLTGKTVRATRIFLEAVSLAAASGFAVRQYVFPFILEELSAWETPPAPGLPAPTPVDRAGVAAERERIIRGPNIHLRGVALRLRAMDTLRGGGETSQVRDDLEESERYLVRSGDPVELAKTRVQAARLAQREGEQEKAARLAREAWRELCRYGEAYFPAEFAPLLTTSSLPHTVNADPADLSVRILDLIEAFVPGAEPDAQRERIVLALTRFLRAQRGAFFRLPDAAGASQPVMRSSCNMTADDIAGEKFAVSRRMVERCLRNNEIVSAGAARKGAQARTMQPSILCLPVAVRGRVRGVLYFDISYPEDGYAFPGTAILEKIGRQAGALIERIEDYGRLAARRLVTATETSAGTGAPLPEILGDSAAVRFVLDQGDRVAGRDAAILITGETGTGKELLARRIHGRSNRAAGPFIVIDMATMPEGLVESELFGHERGAFTGADRQKLGRIELAHGGTLFIDEVGEIPPAVQVRLLRVLQEKTFMRIGGTRELRCDFRLIAATNRELAREVFRGAFRADLFYRINVVPLSMPPLRERGDDVLLIARHYLGLYARRYNRPGLTLGRDDETKLRAHTWPGNVRELQNIVERAVLLSENDSLDLGLTETVRSTAADLVADTPTLAELERRYITAILKKTDGRIAGKNGAAALLGMKRTTLYTRMKKLGLRERKQAPAP